MEETMKYSDGTEYDHLVNGLICQAQLTKISPNGKWIASSYRTETPADNRTFHHHADGRFSQHRDRDDDR